MAKFLSGRKTNLKLGITDHTVNDTVLQTIGKVGIGVTNAGHFSLYVDGPTNITGDALVGGGLTVSGTLEANNIIIDGGGNTQIGDDIVTRNLKATGITTLATLNTGDLIGVGATFSGNVSIAGTLTYEDVTNVDAVGLVTAREGIRIPYDNKMLQIGLGDDLQLYHQANNSYIKDNGTGSLRILGGNTTFMNAAENKTSAVFNVATSVDLYNNNVLRLQTTGYGVTVYDTLQAPQLNITGVSTFAGNIDANGDLDVDGHTELDNVNISGILTAAQFTGGGGGGGTIIGDDITTRNLNVTGLSTFAGIIDANGGANISGGSTLDLLNVTGVSTFGGWVYGDRFINSTTSQDPWLKGVNASGTETSYVKKDGTAMFAGNIIANGNIVGDNATNITGIAGVFASTLSGTLQTSAQPNVNSLGILTGLDVNGHTELDDVNISGISTFGGLVSVGGTTGTDGQYLRSTGVGVTWSSFPTMRTSQSFTATEGQTTFNFDYNVSLLDVFLNGVKLTPSEYTASNGSTVVLDSGCFAGDTIDLYSYNVASTGSSGGPGPAGPSGSKGQKGQAGSGPGGAGAKGQKGEVGSTGPAGSAGSAGPSGSKGQKGTSGNDGSDGSKGQKGQTGAGTSGAKGQKGEVGSGGSAGSKGQKGQTGAGSAGPAGSKGQKGQTGTGSDGSDGSKGQKGQTGTGSAGPAGSKGQKGAAGSAGSAESIVSVWTLGASGSSHYTFTGPGLTGAENDPTIYLVRGQSYRFTNNSGGSHPFQIRYNSNGTAYSDGITNNGASTGNIDFNVQYDAPDVLYYQCTAHSGMLGKIIILGDIISEGSWTASAGSAQTIDTITGVANNAIKTAEYTIHIENGSNMQAQKVLVMQDGTTAYSQEYAIMDKSGLLVSMSATISGGNLLLQATPETGVSGTTTYKITRQTMR